MGEAVVEREDDEHLVCLVDSDYRVCLLYVCCVVSVSQEDTLRVCCRSRCVADVCVVIWVDGLVSLDEEILMFRKELVTHLDDFAYVHFVFLLVSDLVEDDHLLDHRALRKDSPYLCELELRCDDIL